MNAAVSAPKKVGAVCLEQEQWEALERLSEQHERPKSFFVRKALTLYLMEIDGLREEAEAAR